MTVLPQIAQKLTIHITPIRGSIFLDQEGTAVAFTKDDIGLSKESVVWQRADTIQVANWKCGFCDEGVASNQGYVATPVGGDQRLAFIRICPMCQGPTLFTRYGEHFPISKPGSAVEHVPEDLHKLYNEARAAVTAGAHTAAVMVCRKMLMNIAHDQGAQPADLKNFKKAVEYLVEHGYVPPHGDKRVWEIRDRGNEANHEIALMEHEDAVTIVKLVEYLLLFNYELPGIAPSEEEETQEE